MNNSALNVDNFREHVSAVSGYPEGRIVIVTYFSKNAPITDIQSKVVDLATEAKDSVHTSWTQIRNMELRCQNEFTFDFDMDKNVGKIESEALMFPGFTPKVSDLFLYELRNGKIGVFTISSIQRLAIGQDTYFKITFTAQEFLTASKRNLLQKQTSMVCYFDKVKFIYGNKALLKSEEYIQQNELISIRKEIIRNYMDRFYSKDFSSFIRPDGLYDPYVVEYWNRKVSITDGGVRPTQILISVQNYGKTIWSLLTGSPIKNVKNLEHNWGVMKCVSTFWGTNITSLLGHHFLYVGNEKAIENYMFSGEKPTVPSVYPYAYVKKYESLLKMASRSVGKLLSEAFYGDFLPKRKCLSHSHLGTGLRHCHICSECNYEYPVHEYLGVCYTHPPYPIMSNQDLVKKWMEISKIESSAILTEEQLAKARGFVEWYRNRYPGTYSRMELEFIWARDRFPDDYILTDEDLTDFYTFLFTYRSRYEKVLTDKELEYLWKAKHNIPVDEILIDRDIVEFMNFVELYRKNHGYPPDDGFPDDRPAPLSIPELDGDEVDSGFGIIPPNGDPCKSPISHDPHDHHHHCHGCDHECRRECHYPENVCQEHCGSVDRPEPKPEINTYYALSKEFYLGCSVLDPFEQIVRQAIENGTINPAKALDAVSCYIDWKDEDAFYRHLLSIFIIDSALKYVRHYA